MILGRGSEPQLLVSHLITKVNDQYTYNHSEPIQPLYVSVSLRHSMNNMRYSTLNYIIGFVLDDTAQPQANISVLSTCITFKVDMFQVSE